MRKCEVRPVENRVAHKKVLLGLKECKGLHGISFLNGICKISFGCVWKFFAVFIYFYLFLFFGGGGRGGATKTRNVHPYCAKKVKTLIDTEFTKKSKNS